MNVNDFDFELPEHLIAQTPLADRTASRLLVLHRQTGAVEHRRFIDLIDYLHPGDTIVLNDTKVLPARLYGLKKDTGAAIELLLLRQTADKVWRVLAKPAKRVKVGSELVFSDDLTAVVEEEHEAGERTIRFACNGVFMERLAQIGEMPLPPYIHEKLTDKQRYQTVYARAEGSAAAPTAGLHFTEDYLDRVRAKGIDIGFVTLHVGLGTFRPVMVEQVSDHEMHAEYYIVPQTTAQLLQQTRARGGRIIGIGTTSVRTLETVGQMPDFSSVGFRACSGWTDIFIYPGFEFRAIDSMFTNFHLPKSTLMMMISAFAGREHVMNAYASAIAEQYRFFSFGDAMLIL